MAKKWSLAGQAFCEAAALHLKASGRHDAATNYIDAGNCYKKSEPNGIINLIFLYFCHLIIFWKYRGSCLSSEGNRNLYRHGKIFNCCKTSSDNC